MINDRFPEAGLREPGSAPDTPSPPGSHSSALDEFLHRYAPKRDDTRGPRAPELVVLGADGPGALSLLCRQYAEKAVDGESLSEIAAVRHGSVVNEIWARSSPR